MRHELPTKYMYDSVKKEHTDIIEKLFVISNKNAFQ